MNKPYIVGIAGGSASGKTTFIKSVFEHLGEENICLVSQDNYYLPIEQQLADDKGVVNFDLPTSIDREKFANDINLLMQNKTVLLKEYTFNNANSQPKLITLKPAPIVVVEGLFVFYYKEIFDLLDLRIFIDAKEKIKLHRRLKRDLHERGYPNEEVQYQWKNHVVPSYKSYLKPFKKHVDIVVNNNDHFKNALEMVVDHLKAKSQRLAND